MEVDQKVWTTSLVIFNLFKFSQAYYHDMPTLLFSKIWWRPAHREKCLNLMQLWGGSLSWNNLVNEILYYFIILFWNLQGNCTCNLTFSSIVGRKMLLSSLLRSFTTTSPFLPYNCKSLCVSTYGHLTELWMLSYFAGAEIRHDGVGHNDNWGGTGCGILYIFRTGYRVSEIGTNIQIIRTYMLHQHKMSNP